MKRFIHLLDGMPSLGGNMRTKYNQYHYVVVPRKRYLEEMNVQFHMQIQVVGIECDITPEKKTATALHTLCKNRKP